MRLDEMVIVVLMLSAFGSFGQYIEIKGKVIDASTSAPLPFANMQIQNTLNGTSTNSEGSFKLVTVKRSKPRVLLVSYIGYTSKSFFVDTDTTLTIRLVPDARMLREVIIMPDSSLKAFLRKAFMKIPENYPLKPYLLNGFYRESFRSPYNQYIYLGEADLDLFGSGYQYTVEDGQIRINKSRVHNFQGADTLNNVLFYGGPFIGNWQDAVKRRADYLKPDFKNYSYELKGITSNNGKEVWAIEFKKKDQLVQGTIYIEKESMAYVRIDVGEKYKGILSGAELHVTRLRRDSKVLYKTVNGKWFLYYAGLENLKLIRRLKKNIIGKLEFSVSKISTDSVKPIPFDQRINYGTIFSQLNNKYDNEFWKDATVLEQDSSLVRQVKPLYTPAETEQIVSKNLTLVKSPLPGVKSAQTNQNSRYLAYKFLSRFSAGIGAQLLPYNFNNTSITMYYPNPSQDITSVKQKDKMGIPLLLALTYSYKLGNRWRLWFNTSISLGKGDQFNSSEFSGSYAFLIKRKGNPLTLSPSISYGWQNIDMNFPEFDNPGGVDFNGSTLTESKMHFSVYEKYTFFKPSVLLEQKLRGRKFVYLHAGYYVPLSEATNLNLIAQSSGKAYSQPLGGSPATMTINGQPYSNLSSQYTNVYLMLGIRLGL